MSPDLAFRITATGNTAPAFNETRSQIDRMKGAISSFRREASMARSLLAGFAGGIGFNLVSSLEEIPRAFVAIVHEGAGLVSTAEHLGVTTDELQKLRYAAQLAHVDIGTMDSALEFFSKNTADAAAGGADRFRAALQLNGVALRDNEGKLRPVNALFTDYLGILSRTENQQDKNLLSILAFGRGAAEMGDLAKNGAAGVKDAGDELDRLGGVMSKVELDKMKEIDDAFIRTGAVLETFAKRAATSGVNAAEAVGTEMETISKSLDDFEKSPSWETLKRLLFGRGSATGGMSDSASASIEAMKPLNLGLDDPAKKLPGAKVPPPPGTPGVDPIKKRYDDLTASLRLHLAQLTMNDREQAIANELARLGAGATQSQKDEVTALTGQLYDEQTALKSTIDHLDQIREAARDVLGTFISDLEEGKSLTESLGDAFKHLADKLINSGLDNLIGQLFGGAGTISTGLLGTIFGGFHASGGNIGAGKVGIVGERGPEFIRGPAAITPMNAANVNRPSVVHIIMGEGDLFRPVVRQISGEVSVQVTKSGLGAYHQETMRQQKRAG